MGNRTSQLWRAGTRRDSASEEEKRSEDSKRRPIVDSKLPPSYGSHNIPTPPRTSGTYHTPRTSGADHTPPRTSSDATPPRISCGDITPPRTSVDDSVYPMEDETLNDPDMINFDHGMKQRTEKVLGSLAQGMKSGALELSSLKDVTSGLLEMNQDVFQFILDCELDVWANSEMKELVTEYFDHSLEALNFCGALERSVQNVRDNQMIIELAISHMPEDGELNVDQCQRILHELQNFINAKNPFSTEFNQLFTQVYDRQRQLLLKLSDKKRKFHKKERNARWLMKVTTVILTATCVSLVVCAAVAMAVAAPLTGNSVASSAALPFETMHSWLRSLWKNFEQKINAERGVIDATNWGTWVAIKDLDTISTEVERLKDEIERIIRNIKFGQERGDPLAVKQSVSAITRGQKQFILALEDLKDHVNDCVRRITKSRAIVLEKILGRPDRVFTSYSV